MERERPNGVQSVADPACNCQSFVGVGTCVLDTVELDRELREVAEVDRLEPRHAELANGCERFPRQLGSFFEVAFPCGQEAEVPDDSRFLGPLTELACAQEPRLPDRARLGEVSSRGSCPAQPNLQVKR